VLPDSEIDDSDIAPLTDEQFAGMAAYRRSKTTPSPSASETTFWTGRDRRGSSPECRPSGVSSAR